MRSHIRPCGVQLLIAFAGGLCAIALVTTETRAIVKVTGNVWLSDDASGPTYTVYADNPLTTTVFEGIPPNGNRIDPNRGANDQVEYEGRAVGNTNVNFDLIVGRSSPGEVLVSESTLRDQNLIIGDQATINGVLRRGTGIMRIEGFGGLFNNDPTIILWVPGQDPDNPESPSVVARPDNVGFDMFVGRFGNGTLQLATGGRAEIQDAAIVGDQSGSVGTIVIDGIDSLLQSGGFPTDSTNPEDVNYMIVGRLGSGTMNILNGGQSFNSGPAPTNPTDIFGAVIGSNLAAIDNTSPAAGGNGTVNVDGAASKWIVGGNLQVGGFHDNRTGVGPLAEEDLEGNLAVYGSGVGHGTLNVRNGALVSIVPPPLDPNASNTPDRLDLLVGYFGTINLETGGRIELLGAFDSQDPQDPTQELNRGRLINDGVVSGDGSISVLQFRNRVLGRVHVNADEKLKISATGGYTEVDNVPLPNEEEYPLSNFGVISVLGTETARAEIEFDRDKLAPLVPATIIGVPNRPFLNLPIPTTEPPAPNGRTEGLIHGEYSTMRFNSGLSNRGVLAFTAGDNVVSGDVVNEAQSLSPTDDDGTLIIGSTSGTPTSVVFEDDFVNNGNVVINPNSNWTVLAGNSFVNTGTMNITVFGSAAGMEYNPSLDAGNATLGGILNVTLLNGTLVPPLSSVSLLNVGGSIIGNFAEVNVFGSPLEFFTVAQGGSLLLQSFMIPAVAGPDLNGDGVVNAMDYAIWKQNFGNSGPIGTVAGDANGDGLVNAVDYLVWRDNCCTAPGAGGGGLGGIGGGTVPEPASAVLLACGSMLALAFGRRRVK